MNLEKAINHGAHGVHGGKTGMYGRQVAHRAGEWVLPSQVLSFAVCAVFAVVQMGFLG
jgi:hypothetical protein